VAVKDHQKVLYLDQSQGHLQTIQLIKEKSHLQILKTMRK